MIGSEKQLLEYIDKQVHKKLPQNRPRMYCDAEENPNCNLCTTINIANFLKLFEDNKIHGFFTKYTENNKDTPICPLNKVFEFFYQVKDDRCVSNNTHFLSCFWI